MPPGARLLPLGEAATLEEIRAAFRKCAEFGHHHVDGAARPCLRGHRAAGHRVQPQHRPRAACRRHGQERHPDRRIRQSPAGSGRYRARSHREGHQHPSAPRHDDMIATILGGVPLVLAQGAGAEARIALGWVIVGGLGFATLVTLYITPVSYLLIARFAKPQADEEIRLHRELELAARRKALEEDKPAAGRNKNGCRQLPSGAIAMLDKALTLSHTT
ncbi:hypothetical protein Lal_00012459 [Lupinus albus]|nr:hypothetical protein Lal_00012459 [Lupinus albus]